MAQSCLFFPLFGITDITASLHEGGRSPPCRTALRAGNIIGTICCLNILYHSDVNPSGPGDLFALRLDIALFNSSSVISAVSLVLNESLTRGSLNAARKDSFLTVSITCAWEYSRE